MQVSNKRTIIDGYRNGTDEHGYFNEYAGSFVCAYSDCGVFARHDWGMVRRLSIPLSISTSASRESEGPPIILALCEACKRETVLIDGNFVWPRHSVAPPPTADLPAELREDFEEARLIAADSPRGAAALLRLVLQKLCPLVGASASNINDAIAELVRDGKVSPQIQQALDSVRVVGNEAVHPGEMDLRDDQETVLTLFRLINFIVEKTITEPKEIAQIYGSLPAAKLAGIANRDGEASA